MLGRRQFVRGVFAGAVLSAAWPARWGRAADESASLDATTLAALRDSEFVYVSPLKSNGKESRCHAEVWYSWIDGEVVMTVSTEGWKARAIENGLDRARIWVGNHGRIKGLNSFSQGFREAPHFEAKGRRVWDEALLERLLESYDSKYPEEIGRWRDRMRAGNKDRSRVLIRYAPISSTAS